MTSAAAKEPLLTDADAEKAAAGLQEEIKKLQALLKDANDAKAAAEAKAAELEAKQKQGLCGALCACLSKPKEKSQAEAMADDRKALLDSERPVIETKVKKIMGDHGITVASVRSELISNVGVDSIGLQVMTQELADEFGIQPEDVAENAPIGETTTVGQLFDALIAFALKTHVEAKLQAKYGTDAPAAAAPPETDAASKATPAQEPAGKPKVEDPDATAPTKPVAVPKATAAELLEEAGLAHLSAGALGDLAACRQATAEGRPALLKYLKDDAGLAKLQDRQKLASSLSRAVREGRF